MGRQKKGKITEKQNSFNPQFCCCSTSITRSASGITQPGLDELAEKKTTTKNKTPLSLILTAAVQPE
jgi:hypothetical protein